jgi:hypothetical protein
MTQRAESKSHDAQTGNPVTRQADVERRSAAYSAHPTEGPGSLETELHARYMAVRHPHDMELLCSQAIEDVARLERERNEALSCLSELHAMVWGECPSLLNEDSGGCGRLDVAIRAILERHK